MFTQHPTAFFKDNYQDFTLTHRQLCGTVIPDKCSGVTIYRQPFSWYPATLPRFVGTPKPSLELWIFFFDRDRITMLEYQRVRICGSVRRNDPALLVRHIRILDQLPVPSPPWESVFFSLPESLNAFRSRNSICPFRLRRSSSAHRCNCR